MKKIFTHIFAIAALFMGLTCSAQAAYLTVDRISWDFTAQNGSAIPFTSLSSTSVYDISTGAIVAFTVTTPGAPQFSLANLGAFLGIYPGNGQVAIVTGDVLNGIGDPVPSTDDWLAYLDLFSPAVLELSYSIAGINDIFTSTTSSFTSSIADDFGVPEPGTLALGAIAALAGLTIRRKSAR